MQWLCYGSSHHVQQLKTDNLWQTYIWNMAVIACMSFVVENIMFCYLTGDDFSVYNGTPWCSRITFYSYTVWSTGGQNPIMVLINILVIFVSLLLVFFLSVYCECLRGEGVYICWEYLVSLRVWRIDQWKIKSHHHHPLTARVVGAPQMILLSVSLSPLPLLIFLRNKTHLW